MWNKFCQLCQSYWVFNLYSFSILVYFDISLSYSQGQYWIFIILKKQPSTHATPTMNIIPPLSCLSRLIFALVFFYNAAYSAKSFVLSDEGLIHNPPHSTWIAEYLRLLSFYHKPNTTDMDLHPDTWFKCSGYQTATQSGFSPFISLYLSKFSSTQSWYSWKIPESNMGLYDTFWMHHFNR